jgi:serine protease Do
MRWGRAAIGRRLHGRRSVYLKERSDMSSVSPLVHAARDLGRLLIFAVLVSIPVAAQNQPDSLSASFRRAAERVTPALVGIRPIGVSRPLVTLPIPAVGPFRPGDFIPRGMQRGGETEAETIGSGFVIDADRGIVVTTEGVLRGSSQAIVMFSDGAERPVSQIRRDPRSELAVLVVDLKGLNSSAAAWGDSDALEPGDWVLAVGSGGGFPPSMSAGIYSARRRGVGLTPGDEWLETDTRLGGVNVGGPLVNLKGEVVGLCAGLPGRPREPGGTNYVVPAARVRRIATDLLEFGQVRRGYLGVQVEPIDVLSGAPGAVVISSVSAGTPAAAAGLRGGDRITSVNGRRLIWLGQLQSVVEETPIDGEVALTIDRNGQRIEVKVRTQAQPVASELGAMPRSRIEGARPRDAVRDRVRSRVVPARPAPAPANPKDGSEPSSLEPIPGLDQTPDRPAPVPSTPRPEGSAP